MYTRDYPTSPTFSSFQRTMKPSPLPQTPTYPSPARSDPDTTGYPPTEGLGLYSYPMPLPGSAPQSAAMYPPSPHPTESWSNPPSGTSPLLNEPHGEPWNAVYEPRVSRSPGPWNGQYTVPPSALIRDRRSPAHFQSHGFSHRASLSSSSIPMYTRDEQDPTFTPHVKVETMEAGSGWSLDVDASGPHVLHHQPLTVAPDRLSTAAFPYSYSYGSPILPKYESTPEENGEFEVKAFGRPASSRRRSYGGKQQTTGPVQRTRVRRNPTTEENANFRCNVCGKMFQRSYNWKTHMETHDPDRPYPNHCQYEGCNRKFVRRTDLQRHEQSVHLKARNFKCSLCDQSFARKDTLRRHEDDGCSKRFQVHDPELALRHSSSARAAAGHMPGRHSIRVASQSRPPSMF